MADKVSEYKNRRYNRILSRMDADEKGSWITTENGHKVYLNENGQPDKGNPKVIEKMTSGGSKAGERNEKLNNAIKEQGKYKVLDSLRDYVSDMEVGDTVECKNYKTGKIMKFKKMSNGNTISAFKDLNGNNTMASPEHVFGWMKDSILYGDYTPKFE